MLCRPKIVARRWQKWPETPPHVHVAWSLPSLLLMGPSPISELPVVITQACRKRSVQELSFLLCSWRGPGAETAVLLLILTYFRLSTDKGAHVHCLWEDFTTGANVRIKRCCSGFAENSTLPWVQRSHDGDLTLQDVNTQQVCIFTLPFSTFFRWHPPSSLGCKKVLYTMSSGRTNGEEGRRLLLDQVKSSLTQTWIKWMNMHMLVWICGLSAICLHVFNSHRRPKAAAIDFPPPTFCRDLTETPKELNYCHYDAKNDWWEYITLQSVDWLNVSKNAASA